MKLRPETIRDFQEAYLKDFGESISKEEAEELGKSLLTILKVFYRPIPASHIDINKPP